MHIENSIKDKLNVSSLKLSLYLSFINPVFIYTQQILERIEVKDILKHDEHLKLSANILFRF